MRWISMFAVLALTIQAEAAGRIFKRNRPCALSTPAQPKPVTPADSWPAGVPRPMPSSPPINPPAQSLAQMKAEIQARLGSCYHPQGHGLGGGSSEGCGFSSSSPDRAITNCCYWGQRTPIDIGVARGINGWYACVIYQ
jgi:hypothetical protein